MNPLRLATLDASPFCYAKRGGVPVGVPPLSFGTPSESPPGRGRGGGSRGKPSTPPLWMDVPSRERPAFAGMTGVVQRSHRRRGDLVRAPFVLRTFPPQAGETVRISNEKLGA